MRTFVHPFFLLATAALCAAPELILTIADPAGAPIEDARVTVFAANSTTPIATVQAADGRVSMGSLAPARYLLQISAQGFRQSTLTVEHPRAAAVEVRLEIAGVRQSVLVTAESSAQTIDELSKATTLLDRAELFERNEYSIAESLRNLPGLQIRNLGGPGQQTSVRSRGLRPEATAILIDGFRFRDTATTQGDASSFLASLNLINPGNVEVLHGSGSSLYGTNAVGAAINVVTDSGGGPLHGDAQFEGGALGLLRGRTSLGGSALSNRLLLSGGLLHLNVLHGVDGNDRARSSGAQGFLRYALKPSLLATARYWGSDDFVQPNTSPTASGLPAANIPNTTIVNAIPHVTFLPNRDDPDNHRASRFHSTAFTLQQSASARWNWRSSYHRIQTDRAFRNGPGGPGFQPLVRGVSEFDGVIDTAEGRAAWRPTSWYTLSGGYEFEHENYRNADDDNMPGPSRVNVLTTARQDSHAAWLQTQIAMFQRRLQVSLSGRAQRFNLQSRTASAAPPQALTGDVAISYFHPSSGAKLRAHGGNAYRAPSLYERFGSGFYFDPTAGGVVFTPYGDPRLAPDRYNSLDAGIDKYLWRDRIRLSGTFFYSRIQQLIGFDFSYAIVNPATDPFGRTSGYYNGRGGHSRGVESEAQFRPTRSTTLRTAYSYTNSDTDQDLQVSGFFSAFAIPTHAVSLTATQHFGNRTFVNFDLYRSSDYFGPLSAAGRARAYRYPGITKADLVLSRQINRSEKRPVRLYLKLDNLNNQTYYENGFLAPRATWTSGLQVMFQ